MKHLNNLNEGSLHLWDRKSGKRLNIKPGLNIVSDEDLALHSKNLAKCSGLEEVEAMNDMPEAKCSEDACEASPEFPKKSKKNKKLPENLEPLNESE